MSRPNFAYFFLRLVLPTEFPPKGKFSWRCRCGSSSLDTRTDVARLEGGRPLEAHAELASRVHCGERPKARAKASEAKGLKI